jgi:FkbM family methyltransferase
MPPQGLAADLTTLFPDGATNVFDVGAYVGEFAAMIHGSFPAARVWCFEPFPSSYERIRTRFNGAEWLTVNNVAVSHRSGTADLMVGSDQTTNSLVSPVVTNGTFVTALPTVVVQVTTLADCVREALGANPALSILKVDTEGNDLNVLKGGEELLRSHRVEAIHVEVMFMEHFHGAPGFVDICHYLHGFAYRLFSFYDLKKNPQGQLRYGNALFLSPHRQQFAGIAR